MCGVADDPGAVRFITTASSTRKCKISEAQPFVSSRMGVRPMRVPTGADSLPVGGDEEPMRAGHHASRVTRVPTRWGRIGSLASPRGTRPDRMPSLAGRRGRQAAKAPRGRISKHTLVDEEPSWPDRRPSLAGYEGSWPDRLP